MFVQNTQSIWFYFNTKKNSIFFTKILEIFFLLFWVWEIGKNQNFKQKTFIGYKKLLTTKKTRIKTWNFLSKNKIIWDFFKTYFKKF